MSDVVSRPFFPALAILLTQFDTDLIDFRVDEFKGDFTINALCDVLSKDGCKLETKGQINAVEWLNDMLKSSVLYEKITQCKSPQKPSDSLKSLKDDYEKTKSPANLKRLNRTLLEEFYPQESPKSFGDCVAMIPRVSIVASAREKAKTHAYWKPLLELSDGIVEAFTKEYRVRNRYHVTKNPELPLPPEVGDFLRMLTCIEHGIPPEAFFIMKAEACREASVKIANGQYKHQT